MTDLSEKIIEAACAAIESTELEYWIKLTALVDNVSTYTATVEGHEPQTFGSHADASDYVQHIRRTAKAKAALLAVLPMAAEEIRREQADRPDPSRAPDRSFRQLLEMKNRAAETAQERVDAFFSSLIGDLK